MRNILKKKCCGSAMVSSAIYFPIIILTTLFAIHMMLNQYEEVKQTSEMHMELRADAAVDEKPASGSIYGNKYLEKKGALNFGGGRLTGYKTQKAKYRARSYLIDEQDEITKKLLKLLR
jgi:hypothetical protein